MRVASTKEEERHFVPSERLAAFPSVSEGPWVSKRMEAKENRKNSWTALLTPRMLAQG